MTAPSKRAILDDAKRSGEVQEGQRTAGGKCRGADAYQTLGQMDMNQRAAALKRGRSKLSHTVRQNYAAESLTVGEGMRAEADLARHVTKAQYAQALASHEGTLADVGKAAVASHTQIHKGGTVGEGTTTDLLQRIGQDDSAHRGASLKRAVGHRYHGATVGSARGNHQHGRIDQRAARDLTGIGRQGSVGKALESVRAEDAL